MIKISSLLAVSLFLTSQLTATDYVWTPGTTNAYNTASNWTPPNNFTQTGDSVIFNQSTPSTNLDMTISETLTNIIFNTTTPYSITTATMNGFDIRGNTPSIQVLAGSHTLDVPMAIGMNTTLLVNPGSTITFGPNTTFTSPAVLTMTGGGDVILQNSTTSYGLANLVVDGVNIINNNSTPPTANGTIVFNSGTLLNQGSYFAVSCPVVTINGGTLTNTPGNFIADDVGILTINGGTINNNASTVGGNNYVNNILNGGVFNNLNGSNAFGGSTLTTINGGVFNNESGSSIVSQEIVMNGGTFNNQGGGTQGLNGAIKTTINGGVINSGTGAVLFPGSASTSITGGTINNGASSSILGNVITMTGGTINNAAGAIVSPALFVLNGGSVFNNGTMSPAIYMQNGMGTLVTQITDQTTHGSLTAGSISLNGTFGAQGNSNFNVLPGQQVTVITGPYTGRFSNVFGLDLPDLLPVLSYNANSISVSFVPTVFSYPNIAEALFASVNHVNLGLARRMNRLHDQMNSSQPSTNIAVNALPQPDELLASADLAWKKPSKQKQQDLKESVAAKPSRKLNLYVGPLGSIGEVSSRKEQVGYDYTSVGALIGVDYAFSKVGLGFLFDYESIDADMKHHWGDFDVNQIHGSLYGTYLPTKEFAINAIVGGGYDWYSIDRKTGLSANRTTAKGSPSGNEFDALLGVEYTGVMNQTEVMPYFNGQYVHVFIDQYHEKGADLFNLKVHSQEAKSLRSMLGMRINHTWKRTSFDFIPELNFAWQHEFLDKHRDIGVSPIEVVGPGSSVTLVESGRNTGLVGLNLLFRFFDRYDLEFNYDYEWNKRYQDHFLLGAFNVRF
jgi:uncharacterized protein YhjY with autotransporter beta-barrel domain